MRLPTWIPATLGLVLVSSAALFLTEAGFLGPRPTLRTVTLHADQFAFQPATFTVQQGDRVRVEVLADDVAHGFYLDGYGVQGSAMPGHPGVVEFTANRAGTQRFRCSVTCGPLHPFMIGELTVIPASQFNPGPFVATVVLAVLAAIGTVAVVWRGPRTQELVHG